MPSTAPFRRAFDRFTGHSCDTPNRSAGTVNPDAHTTDAPDTRAEPERFATEPSSTVTPPTFTRAAAPDFCRDTATSATPAFGTSHPDPPATKPTSTGTHEPPRRTRTGVAKISRSNCPFGVAHT